MLEMTSFGRQIRLLARERPSVVAVKSIGPSGDVTDLTWSGLDARSELAARALVERGVCQGDWVVVELRNGPAHYVASIAVWKAGAGVIPLRWDLPPAERAAILAAIRPALIVGDTDGADMTVDDLVPSKGAPALGDVVPVPGKAISSGGSTGLPKIIVDPLPWARPGAVLGGPFDAAANLMRFAGEQVQLVLGPLSFNAPFCWSMWGLYLGQQQVVLEKFDAALALDAIERYGVSTFFAVPTMLVRMLRADAQDRDLTSITCVFHAGATCPEWAKRAWIDLLGGERVVELYGGTEATGVTGITGTEWLERPGSVGRPLGGEIKILDEDRIEVPTGSIGEIFMRSDGPTRYRYLNAPPCEEVAGGFATIGDFGRVDEDGYLYIADRRTDLILSGGANVYPAEVEGVLSEHPGISDVVVVGVPDDDWGQRVHAVVAVGDGVQLSAEDVIGFAKMRLATYKVPKSVSFERQLPRSESGKVRRKDVAAAVGGTDA